MHITGCSLHFVFIYHLGKITYSYHVILTVPNFVAIRSFLYSQYLLYIFIKCVLIDKLIREMNKLVFFTLHELLTNAM